MATNGSFNSTYVGNFYATISWSKTHNAEKNEHYISWKIVAHNTPGSYRTVYARSLTINGSSVLNVTSSSGENGKQCYDGTVIAEDTTTVPSSNDAGDGSLAMVFAMGVGQYPRTNASGDGSWTLDRIPRQTSFTSHSIASTTMNSITISWAAADTCSNVYYSLSGGSWTWAGGESKSGSYIVSPVAANTGFNIRTKVIRKDSGMETISGYLYPTTKAPAASSSVQTLTLPAPGNATNVRHYITNYSTRTATIYLEKLNTAGSYNNNATYSWGNGADGWADYPISASTVNKMYADYPTSTSFNMQLVTKTSENYDYWDVDAFTVQITEANAGPTAIAACTYLDTNSKTRTLTGSSSSAVSSGLKIIPGYSNIQINVPANPLTLRTNSGATQKTVSIAGRTAQSSTVARSETINAATASSYNIVATDSRDFSKTRTMTVELFPYTGLTISSFTATRDSTDNTIGTYTINGTYQNSSYGGSTPNTIKTVTVTCSGITIGAATITHNATAGTWSATGTLSGLTVGMSYTLTASVADYAGKILGLANKTSTTTVNSGQFLMTAVKGKGVCFGGLYNVSKGGAAQLSDDGLPILGFKTETWN
ncbi:MAG: hypothetical protein IJE43_14610 [Alphaproteobacteria bacterium]|nr:hypothetical protein [Alphaproteobacteria bacterium]